MGQSLLISLNCTTKIDENFANDKFFSVQDSISEYTSVNDALELTLRAATTNSASEAMLELESNLLAINNSIDFINQLFYKSSI